MKATAPAAKIRNPAIDALVEAVVGAEDRAALIVACRALDRALTWGHYVVPHWHLGATRLAYWDIMGRPAATPDYGVDLAAWWIDADKAATIEDRAKGVVE